MLGGVPFGSAPFASEQAGGPLSPDVTLSISGVAGTGAVGSVKSAIDYGLTGNAGTGAVGSVQFAISLTGNQATGGVGSLSPAIDVALTGVAGTGAVGTVGVDLSQALTGNQATGGVGSVVPNVDYALSGISAAGDVGSVLSGGGDITVALTGVQATGEVGSVTAPRQESDNSGGYDERGPHPLLSSPKRKTEADIRAERIALGILPPDPDAADEAAQVIERAKGPRGPLPLLVDLQADESFATSTARLKQQQELEEEAVVVELLAMLL